MDGLIEQMKQLVNEFDFANFIPEVDSILGWVETLVRIFVMAAPICILVFGLFFLFPIVYAVITGVCFLMMKIEEKRINEKLNKA